MTAVEILVNSHRFFLLKGKRSNFLGSSWRWMKSYRYKWLYSSSPRLILWIISSLNSLAFSFTAPSSFKLDHFSFKPSFARWNFPTKLSYCSFFSPIVVSRLVTPWKGNLRLVKDKSAAQAALERRVAAVEFKSHAFHILRRRRHRRDWRVLHIIATEKVFQVVYLAFASDKKHHKYC